MKRKLLYLTTIILTLAGCASEDFVGDEDLREANEKGRPVSFNLVAAPRTRAVGGVDAANMLNGNFVVYARKWFADQSDASLLVDPQLVFNNYLVQYADNSANTTTSNSAGWEYVGYYNLPQGTKLANGGTANVGIPAAIPDPVPASGRYEQSIKYWDFAANQYDFLAYSLGVGTGSTPTYADASALYYDDKTTADEETDDDYIGYKYTLTGSAAQLAACYISNLEKKTDLNSSSTEVQLKFRKLETKVRIALYETIPGYSVKDVKFYQSASGTSGYTAYLYGTNAGSPANFVYGDGGTLTVTFENDAAGTPKLEWTSGTPTSSLSFDVCKSLDANNKWRNWTKREYNEPIADEKTENTDTVYIGRASSTATISEFQYVLPNTDNTANLNLKVDYTLVSRDGYGETINVTGATATVPATYAQWQPNSSYTYIFKITDAALYPITLDAVVTQNADGKQETITTVTEPSITTYSSASNVVTNDEYAAGEKVYAVVEDAGSLATLSATNMKLYTVTTTDATNFPITESSVADALLKQTTLTAAQATAASIKCTNATSSLQYSKKVGDTEEIEMDASNNVVAYFTVAANTVYVLQYINTDATYTYDAGQTYADAAAFAAAGTLYTKPGDVYTEATTWTDGTTYYKRTAVSSEGVYAYKVINVASGS